jgi:formamidopyrimidine-DNA glycosylase
MPELPEVQTIVNELRTSVLHATVIRQELSGLSRRRMLKTTVPEMAPFVITDIERFGKYMRFETSIGVRVVLHLGMSGKVVVASRDEPLSPSHAHLQWALADGRHLYLIDPRRFGRIAFYPSGEVIPEEAGMGIDPLSPAFTGKRLRELLNTRSAPVKALLLEQHLIGGIGNIYACEALHRAGVHPLTPGKALSIRAANRLVAEIKAVLDEAITHNGTTIDDYRRVDEKTGEFQNFLQVYGKKTCHCGAAVETIEVAGRNTWFCPTCQKRKTS